MVHPRPTMRVVLLLCIVFLCLASNLPVTFAQADTGRRPHILLVCLDDVGRTDTGVYGKSNIKMPNLVQLSKEGALLENFYTQTVCSPTRSALMTGLYPFRYGMQHFTTALPAMSAGVPFDIPMLPKLLKQVGYDTHMVGKWHCGYSTKSHVPNARGFNTFLGYLQAQGDYFNHNLAIFPAKNPTLVKLQDGFDFWDNDRVMYEAVGNYSLDLFDSRITKIVNEYTKQYDTKQKQDEHPLFVYLAHQTVHIPLQSRGDDQNRCGHLHGHISRRVYCDMLMELDDSLGNTVKQYKAKGLWDNTLLVLLTDNGGMVNFDPKPASGYPNFPASQGSNFPLRGSKTTLFEGGVRSLGFIAGGYFPKEHAHTFKGLAHVVDLSATILAAAKTLSPFQQDQLKLDGNDLWPLLMNTGAGKRRTEIPINIVNAGKSYSAIRFNQYKLIVKHNLFPAAQSWFDRNGDLLELCADERNAVLLYDLDHDAEERHNLASKLPKVVEHGLELIQSYVRSDSYMEPQASMKLRLFAFPLFHGGVWAPFMEEKRWNKNYKWQQLRQHVFNANEEDEEYVMVAGDNFERAQEMFQHKLPISDGGEVATS